MAERERNIVCPEAMGTMNIIPLFDRPLGAILLMGVQQSARVEYRARLFNEIHVVYSLKLP